MKKTTTSLNELLRELYQDKEYLKAERSIAPYYDLAREIIRCRLSKGFTQQDLAKKAGTHQSRISKIESGEHDIRMSTLIQIANALDSQVKIMLMPDEIYIQSDEPYIPIIPSETELEPNSIEFADVN